MNDETSNQLTEPEQVRRADLREEIESFGEQASEAFDPEVAQEQQRDRIAQLKSRFDWEAPENFGSAEAKAVTGFADTMVEQTQSNELGSVHEHLTQLRQVTKGLHDDLEPSGWLSRFFFNSRKALDKFAADWSSVQQQINEIVAQLERDQRGSAVTIENLRELRGESIEQFKWLAAAVAAGNEILEEERQRIEELREQTQGGDDTAEAAELRRLEQRWDLLDRRLTNLEKSRSIAAGMIPTIQQTLQSEVIVSEEIDMALTQAIPTMKQQLALIAEQIRQQERLESLKATRETTEKLMGEVADRLESNQQKVDEQMREGTASAESVAHFIERIGSTIQSIDERQASAQQDRAAARQQLQQAVSQLGEQLAGQSAENTNPEDSTS